MRRSLAELRPHEVLKVAVWIEKRNCAIYENYAQMFRGFDPEIERIFLEMAEEEARHRDDLEAAYRKKFGDLACSLTDEDIREVVEAPVIEDGEVFITDGMRMADALRVGVKAERQAADFYRHLLETTTDPDLRAVFVDLAAVEGDHEELLQQRLDQLEAGSKT